MHIFITGIAGFIGSNLAHTALAQGFEVSGIDDLSTGAVKNIAGIQNKIHFHNGSILDQKLLKKALTDVDFVLHQAAIPSVPRSIKDPVTTSTVNIMGTLNVLVTARDAAVNRIVLASSSSLYGDTPTLPKHEKMEPNPLSPYAVSKLTNELHARQFYELYGLETICLRYFNVFGPWQDPNSEYSAVIPRFITKMLANEPPTIFGDGNQSRDFTYIQDVVMANFNSLEAPKNALGKAFNVGGGNQITLNQLVTLLNKLLAKNVQPIYGNERSGDIKHSYADSSLAKQYLNYLPKYSFEQGLKETIMWFKGR